MDALVPAAAAEWLRVVLRLSGQGTVGYPDNRWVNLPSDRHGRMGTLSYADGHVSKIRWFYPKKFRYYGQDSENDRDLADLRNLQEALPQPRR